MEQLSKQIAILRESAAAVLDDSAPVEGRLTEAGNSLLEIADILTRITADVAIRT